MSLTLANHLLIAHLTLHKLSFIVVALLQNRSIATNLKTVSASECKLPINNLQPLGHSQGNRSNTLPQFRPLTTSILVCILKAHKVPPRKAK